jgi:hypothetical protein
MRVAMMGMAMRVVVAASLIGRMTVGWHAQVLYYNISRVQHLTRQTSR